MSAIDWLLAADPGIRWQALADLTDTPPETVAAERAKVGTEGWGAFLLGRLRPGGDDRPVAAEQPDWVVLETLLVLRAMGVDPQSDEVRGALTWINEEVRWQGVLPQDSQWHGNPFFAGEVEPCINGRVLAVGSYFGPDMRGLVDRLLTEQMADGGWNCEDDNGATVGSFHSTINVLEGLLEYENAASGDASDVTAARLRGQEYLLERGMFRRRSTGEVANDDFLKFAFPPGYRYDVLRGLDFLRVAGAEHGTRLVEAIDIVTGKRNSDGRWPLDIRYENHLDWEMDEGVGQPSYWNTLRALRVLRWARVPA